MKPILIILLVVACGAHAQTTIPATKVIESTTKQFVTATQKTTWNAAATQAKNAATDAGEALNKADSAIKAASETTTFIQGPGVVIKKISEGVYMLSSEYPPRMGTKDRDSLDVKASRGMFIYNLDKDALEVCNGVRWDQITTGIIVTQPPLTAPTKKKR